MKKLITFMLSLFVALLLLPMSAMAQDVPKYKISKWKPTDGGIFTKMSSDGKWGLINQGMTGGDAPTCESRLYNIDTDENFTVQYQGRTLRIEAVSNEDADGMLTITGSFMNRAYSYKFNPKNLAEQGTLQIYATPEFWNSGSLNAITPDGKYAVGMYSGYYGPGSDGNELGSDYYFAPLFVDIANNKIIDTPNLPTRNLAGTDENAMRFDDITPDGRYILGEKDWFIMQPNCPLSFIYDTVEHTYKIIGFTGTTGHYQPVVDGLHHIEYPVFSPNGKLMTGDAYMARPQEGSEFMNEYHTPFIYNMETGEFTSFDDSDSQNVIGNAIDNDGNIYGASEGGSPLRNFKIFANKKYWVPFSQICQQVYGFNFNTKIGFEFTGTPIGVSDNGQRFIAFCDPSEAESYAFDFGIPFSEVAKKVDLLANYTVSPMSGSTFSTFKTIEVNFGRAVQVIGKGNTHVHLYKRGKNGAADELIRDGLSSTGENGGIAMKANSKTTVRFTVRNTTLENGEEYYLIIDEGAVAIANDAEMTNKQIKLSYFGRTDAPVNIVKSIPENGNTVNHLDATTSYVQLTFDCPVILTESYDAYVERLEDEGTTTRIATLSIASGNTDATRNQLLMYPTSIINLYDGITYRVVLAAGSVSDYAGTESSYNKEWSIQIVGSFVREIATETTIFTDDFNDPNASLGKWLQYEGDHNMPLSEMQAWGFDRDNTPWNFSTRDSESTYDYFATSHSLYAPSSKSDDWMMTPQLAIPEDGKAQLSFDAQGYRSSKEDHLSVYIITEDRNISYLNDQNMVVLKGNAQLLADVVPAVGASEGTTAGEWTHYIYNLNEYAGKNIYIAFVNENENQSALFLDNVIVQREVLYSIAFNNEERLVAKDEVSISGKFTVKTPEFQSGAISLTLKDNNGKELSAINWPSVSGSIYDRPIPFAFDKAMPLTIGKENNYTIDIKFDGKDNSGNDFERLETYNGNILNLAFQPVKRVVLEEMTGPTCPNCPQGHIAIEMCVRQYKDQFIPVSIYSYDDVLGTPLTGYTSFLGLNGAPLGRINRIAGNASNAGVFKPMYGMDNKVYYTMPEQNLWYDVVAQELEKLTSCDISLNAWYSEDGRTINATPSVKYALDTNQQTSLLLVVLENGVVSFQENNFASSDAEGFGEWGLGGIYGSYYAYPVTHNYIVRGVVGQTYAGTLGVFPSSFEAGKTYNSDMSFNAPESVTDTNNTFAVAMLIDTQTGEVINAARTKIMSYGEYADGIDGINADEQPGTAIYTISGMKVNNNSNLPTGIYIKNGKKIVIK